MDIETIETFLGWCSAINIALLLWWFLLMVFAREFVCRLHRKWFGISEKSLEIIHYCAMGLYKLTVLVFFVIPYLVLRFGV